MIVVLILQANPELEHVTGSCRLVELQQPEELSLPTEEELMNDSVLNEAFRSAPLLAGNCLDAPEAAMDVAAPIHASQDRDLLDPFLDTLCADLDDATLLNEHDMLLTEAEGALPVDVAVAHQCGDAEGTLGTSHQDPTAASAYEAPIALHDWLPVDDGGVFLDGEIGCPVVDLMFDFDLDNEFASGEFVELCCSGSEGQAHTAGARLPLVGIGAVSCVPVGQDCSADGAASGYTVRHLRTGAASSIDSQKADGDFTAAGQRSPHRSHGSCMHEGAPSESDSEVIIEWAPHQSQVPHSHAGYRESRSQRLLSLTHAETSALPDILTAAQRVRHALVPRGQFVQHEVPPCDAGASGKENSNAAAKGGAQQGKVRGSTQGGRGQKRTLHSEQNDSEDEWTPTKLSPSSRRKARAGKASPPRGAAAAAVHSVSAASASTGSEEANASVFLLPEPSPEPSIEARRSVSVYAAKDSAEHASSARPKKPLKIKLKALRRSSSETPAASDSHPADSAVVTGALADVQMNIVEQPSPGDPKLGVEERCGSSSSDHTLSAIVKPPSRSADDAGAAGKVLSSMSCADGQPESTTDSGKSAVATTSTPQQIENSIPATDAGGRGAVAACDSSIRKKRRVAGSSSECQQPSRVPVCSPAKLPQQDAPPCASALFECASLPSTVAHGCKSTAAAATDRASVPSAELASAAAEAVMPPQASASCTLPGIRVAEDSASADTNAAPSSNKGSCEAAETSVILKQRNPLKRTLDRSKPAATTTAAHSSPEQQPCKAQCNKPPKQPSIASPPRERAPPKCAAPSSINAPQHVSSRPVLPPKSPCVPPPATNSHRQPLQRVPHSPPHPPSAPVTAPVTSSAPPPDPAQRTLPGIIPHPPKCPPPPQPPSQPTTYTPAPPQHAAPCASQPRIRTVTHVIAAPAVPPRHHARGPCISPAQKPHAPNAVYPVLRTQHIPTAIVPTPLVVGALGVAPSTCVAQVVHTPQPPKCPPPATEAHSSDDNKLKLEPMPDLSVLCDIMRATEAPVGDSSGHKGAAQHHHSSPGSVQNPGQLGYGQQGGVPGQQKCPTFQQGGVNGTCLVAGAMTCAATGGAQNPNKSKRERLKALTQGSSRNIAEWGRRQGYHRERVKNAEKRCGSSNGGSSGSGGGGKQRGGSRKHGGEDHKPNTKVKSPGRTQDAMRNRGAQPMLATSCRKERKGPIALPDDTDLFGC